MAKANNPYDLSFSGKGNNTLVNRALPTMHKLVEMGYPPAWAAGIVGNMMAESSMNPDVRNATNHLGLMQNDATIQDYHTRSFGDNSYASQMAFLQQGYNRGITLPWLQQRFNRAFELFGDDPSWNAEVWDKFYELSGGQLLDLRRNFARNIYDAYGRVYPQPVPTMSASIAAHADNFINRMNNLRAFSNQENSVDIHSDTQAAIDNIQNNKQPQDQEEEQQYPSNSDAIFYNYLAGLLQKTEEKQKKEEYNPYLAKKQFLDNYEFI